VIEKPSSFFDIMAVVNGDLDKLSDSSSESDILDTTNDEGWEDLENDEEQITIVSLFEDKTFPDARSMLLHCRDAHDFDIWKLREEHGNSDKV
jgi:type I protein arginine methyltransferase